MEGLHIFKRRLNMINNQLYTGKNCIIFGVNDFIGKTIAKYLAQKNVNLGLIDLDSSKDNKIIDDFKEKKNIIYDTISSGDQNNTEKVVEKIYNNFGEIDFLVCSYYFDDLRKKINPEDLSLKTWENLFQDWVMNYFLVLKTVVPLMIQKQSGKIIFFNTTSGYTGEGEGEGHIILEGSIHESACSSGITGMMTSIAADIIPNGISVNGIALGPEYNIDPKRIIWTINLWLSGLGEYSCGQIIRLY
jgi:NAD(P)-dependent dehydrogenase (short-subunit alcohol dehydrogenase family)